ncbi:hypothetical protein [Nocardioides albus]|uniref:Uncharacterized protein n=1 Tax=Nocardioides albus TaxID=1841 RepID=A0A7W5A480_9ACTN|nr:hypothetical protein [Nocardioides albus]MBB3089120.1 hypothetical protein [Nocardioides albus]
MPESSAWGERSDPRSTPRDATLEPGGLAVDRRWRLLQNVRERVDGSRASASVGSAWSTFQRHASIEGDSVGSGKETKVDHEVVDRMKNVLIEMKVEVDKPRVDTPRAGLLGQGASGESLKKQLDLASERISSSLSQLSDAVIKFYDGTDRAAKEMTSADEDAGDWGRVLDAGVAMVSQPLHMGLGKDDRPDALPIPIPFLPIPPELLQEMQSRAEIVGTSSGEDGA